MSMDVQWNANWKWKEIGLGWLRTDFDWFAIRFQLKIKGNWLDLAQSGFWMICNQIPAEHQMTSAWAGSEQILIENFEKTMEKYKKAYNKCNTLSKKHKNNAFEAW